MSSQICSNRDCVFQKTHFGEKVGVPLTASGHFPQPLQQFIVCHCIEGIEGFEGMLWRIFFWFYLLGMKRWVQESKCGFSPAGLSSKDKLKRREREERTRTEVKEKREFSQKERRRENLHGKKEQRRILREKRKILTSWTGSSGSHRAQRASPQSHQRCHLKQKQVLNHISNSEKPDRQNQTWKCVEHLHPDLVVLFIQTLSVKLVENTFNDFQRVLTCWKVRVFKNSFEDDISIFAPRFLPWARHSPGGRTTCHLPPCLLSHRGPGQQAQVVIQDWVGDCFYTSQTYYRTSVMVKLMPIIDDGVVVTVLLYQNGVGVFF